MAMRKKEETISVACYSSFASNWGAGNSIVEAFKKETGINVELIDCGSGFSLINNIKNLDRDIDAVIGIDQVHISDFNDIVENIQVVDYGYFAFVMDTRADIRQPKSLKDLTKEEYKNKFILIDPRILWEGRRF